MNILFLTLCDINSFEEYHIYCDLLREFKRDGHDVYCISPVERRTGIKTHLTDKGRILKLRILNTQKTNFIEKGISTILIDSWFKRAIRRFFGKVKFDLVLYSTPPITFVNSIRYVRKRDNARTYLMLKDIFPQNALDLGILRKSGLTGFLYRYFRKKETLLYSISDKIGCMSQANIQYVVKNNPDVPVEKLELCPNCIEYQDVSLPEKRPLREKYGIPVDKTVFVYGGNLGKPQGIPFLIEALKTQIDHPEAFFLIVGEGTEYSMIESFIKESNPSNIKLLQTIPKDDYDRMLAACDVGLIFLDYRFTIPNYPSRLLSYMQAELPILACTDTCTDIRETIADGDFGWWCPGNDTETFRRSIQTILQSDLEQKGRNAKQYLLEHFTSVKVYKNMSIH